MFIEKLKAEDYDLLAFILLKNCDTVQTVTKFNKNTTKLTIKEYGETEQYVFYIQDFKLVPASKLAAENYILSNLENSFYKFMKQKFGYVYEFELNNYKKDLWLETTMMLNQ